MKWSLSRNRAQAQVSIPFRKSADVRAFLRAIHPEIRTSKTDRAIVRVTEQGKTLTMRFYAADLVALRALVNSYLRLVAMWKRLSERLGRPM